MSKKVTVQMLSNCQYRKTGPRVDELGIKGNTFYIKTHYMPSSSALIPMSICTLQCLFSHSFTTYE
jgi:hypothetical protein